MKRYLEKNELEARVELLEQILNDLPSEDDLMVENFKYFCEKNYAFMLGFIVEAVRLAKMKVKR